jgi:DNA-binding CsgD family transcriptional regulator
MQADGRPDLCSGAPALATLHLGERFGRDRIRPASSGWDALTRSERKVVELVSKGMSNAEIADRLSISRRTVESHLYHAYPKLGLSNRVELAVFVAQQS